MWVKNQKSLREVKVVALTMATALSHVALAFAADDTVKIGLIGAMTLRQASTGKQLDNAVKPYMQQHGDTVSGKKIEVILKDDSANPENTKRLAQELIVNDKVNIIAGFGITPTAHAHRVGRGPLWLPRLKYRQS